MKYFIPILFIAFLLISQIGCKSGSVTGPTGNVDFTIASGTSTTGEPIITAAPAEDIKLTSVKFKCANLNVNDTTIAYDSSYTYTKGTQYIIVSGAGFVRTGDKWTFTFNGKTVANNSIFSTPKDFTVP